MRISSTGITGRSLLVIILLAQTVTITFACSCLQIDTFCETFAILDNADVVVITAQVGNVHVEEMEVNVIQAIYGTVNQSTLVIPTGNGSMCLANSKQFKPGDKYLFLLRKSGAEANEKFRLSSCGITYLPIKGNKISGPIAPGQNRMSVSDFSPNACMIAHKINVYPNPASRFLNIEIKTKEKTPANLKIFDPIGRLITQKAIEGQKGVKIVHDIQSLSAGLYFVQLSIAETRRTFRIVVQ